MNFPIRIRVIRIPARDGPRIDDLHWCNECGDRAQAAVQRNGGDPEGRLTWWCDEHVVAAAVRITIETNG